MQSTTQQDGGVRQSAFSSPYDKNVWATSEEVVSTAARLSFHQLALDSIRNTGRKLTKDPLWAKNLEFRPGMLDGTIGVPRLLIDELVKAANLTKAYRTILQELSDAELNAQFNALAYPEQQ